MKFTCPCCGYKSLEEGEASCKVCNWINDPYQSMDPDLKDGSNPISLRQAQYRFRGLQRKVVGYEKDNKWCAFSAAPIAVTSLEDFVLHYFSSEKFA